MYQASDTIADGGGKQERQEQKRPGRGQPRFGLDLKEYAIPTNKSVPLPPQVPPLSDFKLIDYDAVKYGASAERKRLLERWEKEINAAR